MLALPGITQGATALLLRPAPGLLHAGYFDNAAWATDPTLLRYMPDVLVAPVEPGISVDYLGGLILNRIDNASGNRLLTLDPDLDYLFTGSTHWASSTPLTASIQLTYGRNLRLIGYDTGGYKTTISRPLRCYVEGVRHDAGATVEDDFLNIGGNASDDDSATTVFTLQMIGGRGLHGTNRGHAAANGLGAAITTAGNRRGHFTLAQAATTTIAVGNDVIVGGTVHGGVARNLNDFNCTWTIDQVVSQTEFYATCQNDRYNAQIPASAATDDTTGRIWIMGSGTGNHADGIQHVNTSDKHSLMVRMHNVTIHTNYCGTILQNVRDRFISNFNYVFTHADPLANPTDDGTEILRNGNQATVDGLGHAELFNVFGQPRPLYTVDEQVSPSTLPSEGGLAKTTAAFGAVRNIVVWKRPEFRGGVVQGLPPGGDFADYDDLGFGYVFDTARYDGYVAPVAANIAAITFTGSTTFGESIAGGAAIGLIDVAHDLGDHPGIVDLSVVGSNVLLNQWHLHGRRLVRGKTAFDYEATPGGGAATVTIRAQWRGTGEYVDTVLPFTIANDVADSGLSLGTAAYTANAVNGSPSTAQAYSGLATGTADAHRHVVAFAANWFSADGRTLNATATITNATNGALTAGKVIGKRCLQTNSNYCEAALYIAAVPADATASATIGLSGSATAGGVALFNLTALDSAAPFSTSAVAVNTVGGQAQFTIDIPANGAAVLGCAYATPSSNNKRFSGAVITSASLATLHVRATVAAGSSGPVTWEKSADGSSWTSVTAAFDTAVESSQGSGTVLLGASFAPRT